MIKNISFYFQHGASICVQINDKYYVVELERLARERYFSLLSIEVEEAIAIIEKTLDILHKKYNIENNFDICIFPGHSLKSQRLAAPLMAAIQKIISAKKFIIIDHHLAHAACAAYQSPFKTGTVISFDGAGNDGRFNIYRFDGTIKHIKRLDVQSFGKCYRQVSYVIKDIKKTHNGKRRSLVGYAGKLMGLVAYGKIRNEWIEGFEEFYRTRDIQHLNNSTKLEHVTEDQFKKFIDNKETFLEYTGQEAYDLAATNQFVFEQEFFKTVAPYVNSEPIILTGGCALNVLLNEKVRNRYGNRVFVPPNPDDSGIALGQLFAANKPNGTISVTYNGLPILDEELEEELLSSYNVESLDIFNVSKLLKEGNIIGILRGNSEIGPRALGNRSIICDPSFEGMKDKLNEIKKREWFRPFASVVRLEDVEQFFNFDYESPYMSFSPTVKKEFIDLMPSISHADGTARVQTVSKTDNSFLYGILSFLKQPLLNTSFNVNGEPMIVSLQQALDVLDNTSLNYLIYKDKLVRKK